MSKDCGFCKGRPIQNAATWLDGKPRPPAECPRCGDTNVPDEEMEQFRRQVAFIDGTGITPGSERCKCGDDCEFPCWQRVGLGPACSACGCPPFAADGGVPYQAWLPDDRRTA